MRRSPNGRPKQHLSPTQAAVFAADRRWQTFEKRLAATRSRSYFCSSPLLIPRASSRPQDVGLRTGCQEGQAGAGSGGGARAHQEDGAHVRGRRLHVEGCAPRHPPALPLPALRGAAPAPRSLCLRRRAALRAPPQRRRAVWHITQPATC